MKIIVITCAFLAAIVLNLGGCSSKSDVGQPPVAAGTIKIRFDPAGFSALWTLNGPESQTYTGAEDTVMTDMPVGRYDIAWEEVSGYYQPAGSVVTLADHEVLTIVGHYVRDTSTPATVIIDVSPDDLPLRWVLKVASGGGLHDAAGIGDAVVEDLPPGLVTVDWQPYPDYVEPDEGERDHTLSSAEVFTAVGGYTPRETLPLRLVPVAGGSFVMGSPEWEMGYDLGGDPRRPIDEAPQHTVTLTQDLLVSETEVTQFQYRDVVGTEPSLHGPSDNLPVERVSWFEAVGFCNALSAAEGLSPAYEIIGSAVNWNQSADGYRLPTEAEWEYLCRGDRPEAFAFGPFTGYGTEADPVLDRLGWYAVNAGGAFRGGPRPVASKLPNAYGLYDMHGNVEEWCWDRYEVDWYAGSPPADPTGPQTGEDRIARGGSYQTYAAGCRSATRNADDPNLSSSARGFRVVRRATPPAADKPLGKN